MGDLTHFAAVIYTVTMALVPKARTYNKLMTINSFSSCCKRKKDGCSNWGPKNEIRTMSDHFQSRTAAKNARDGI